MGNGGSTVTEPLALVRVIVPLTSRRSAVIKVMGVVPTAVAVNVYVTKTPEPEYVLVPKTD